MSEKELTPEQMQALLQAASQKLGVTPEKLVQTVNRGKLSDIAPNLSAESRQKLDAFTQDKTQAEKLLRSPQMQRLIQKLLGGDTADN